jgi:rRNA processing protein Gar1
MQSNNEYGIPISTSNEHPDSHRFLQINLQPGQMENSIPQMAYQQDQRGQTICHGSRINSLPLLQNSQIPHQENVIPSIEEADKILDGICLSEDEDDQKNQNLISEAEYNQEKKKISEFYDDEESMNKYTGTKNETETRKEIPVPFDLNTEDILIEAGLVENIFEDKIIVRVNTFNGILDLDNILFNENKFPLGYLDDVIGKVDSPYYVIKFFPNYDEQMRTSLNLFPGKSIFFPKSRSKQIATRDLINQRGCDASNVFDEEVNQDDLEFSDDEEEISFKHKKKNKSDKVIFDFNEKTSKKQKIEIQEIQNNTKVTNPIFTAEYKINNNFPSNNMNNFFPSNYVHNNMTFSHMDMNSYMNFMMNSNPNINFNPMMQNFNFPNNPIFQGNNNLPSVNPFQYPYKK